MTGVYAVALVVGFVALIAWVAMSVVAANVAGWDRFDPDRRLGRWGRRSIAGLVGFGMAGLSTTYAGWPTGAVVAAAVAGLAGLALVSDWLTRADGP